LMVDQVINLLDGRLPFLSVLIKNYNDYEEYIKEQKEKEKEKEKNKTTAGPAGGEPAVVQPVAEQPAADKSQES